MLLRLIHKTPVLKALPVVGVSGGLNVRCWSSDGMLTLIPYSGSSKKEGLLSPPMPTVFDIK
jgi:hypothetical protein